MNLPCAWIEGFERSVFSIHLPQGVSVNIAKVKNNGSRYCHLSQHLLALLSLVLAVCVLFLGGTAGECQTFYGSIVGSVADSSGALIPGATVKVTQTETNISRETTTNAEGGYTFSTVAAGTYTVSVSKPGFGSFESKGVVLTLNTAARVDATLNISSQVQSVTVDTESAQLQTDSADVHDQITNKEFQDLPQPTRSYQGLIGLMPGVSPPSASTGGTNNPERSMVINANGTSESGTIVRVDGVNATNPWVQYYSLAVPSTDAIQTVNVVTASAGADEGLMNGAAINVQIKSGTNSLHGSVYWYHYDNLLAARPYFLPQGVGLTKNLDNDAGGTVGGPILKNRLFFFGSYEGDFLHTNGDPGIGTVPTDNVRNGIMPLPSSGSAATLIYDPATGNADGTGRTPFAGNVIPVNRISPIAQKVVALIPEPNIPGAGESSNFYYTQPSYYKLQKIDTKFDWTATRKLRLFARFSDYPYNNQTIPEFGSSPLSGTNTDASAYGNTYATSVSATYVATPRFVVEALFGLTHAVQNLVPPFSNQRYGSDVLGIPGTNVGDLPAAGGFPNLRPSGYDSYGYSYPPLVYADPIFQYTVNASWTKGRHNVRFGIDVSQQHMNHIETSNTQLSFTGGVTSLNGGAAPSQFNGFADFLLGLAQNTSSDVQNAPYLTLRTWEFSPYVSDQWQVSPKLTFAIGTRWEYFPVPTRADRGIEFFDFATKQYEICGEGTIAKDCGIHVQKTLLSPRIGLAYRPNESMVLRAGFSLSPEQISQFRDGIYNYPADLNGNYSSANSYSPVTTLAQGIPVLTPPDISSGIIPLPVGATFATSPKNYIRGYTESYNAAVEQDFGKGWLGQIAYVGTHTVHQHTRYNVNYGQVGGGAASQPFYNGTYATGNTASEIEDLAFENMVYNALQTTLNHRFTNGFQVGISYTWSRWIGTCCDTHGDGMPEIPIPQYFYLNRALMPYDRTHNLQVSALAALPFGKNKTFLTHGIAAAIAGGWQLNAIISFDSGEPFTVSASGASLNAPGSSQMADQVKPYVKKFKSVGPDHPWFDTTAFAPVTAVRFGTAGFDSIRGPGFGNADLSLFRSFTIRQRFTAQPRIEVFNITNTPHFSNPDSTVGDTNFGTLTSVSAQARTTDQRYVKLGFKMTF
jgi:hypothetical protein